MKLFPSVYLSLYEAQQEELKNFEKGSFIFICLHMEEEYQSIHNYREKALEIIHELQDHFTIIADVSGRSLGYFGVDSLLELQELLSPCILRPDYGFDPQEVIEHLDQLTLCFNAQIYEEDWLSYLEPGMVSTLNYYPRPETGVSANTVLKQTAPLQERGVKVFGFIQGDKHLRLPLYEGLPTLEKYRYQPPYIAYLALAKLGLDGAIVGDGGLLKRQHQLIGRYREEKVISVPIITEKTEILHQVFTLRQDSPDGLFRIVESREYAHPGELRKKEETKERKRGSITMDNEGYARYSGEMMLLKEDYPEDPRVNVIGQVHQDYEALLDLLEPGDRIMFVEI